LCVAPEPKDLEKLKQRLPLLEYLRQQHWTARPTGHGGEFVGSLSVARGDLATGMQISVSPLSHLFSTQTGVSPKRYLKSIRLRRAGELLEGSSLSVKEVAARVGLDVSRFIKEFRETYGVTPAQHRRLMRLRDLTGVQSAPAPETGRARTTE